MSSAAMTTGRAGPVRHLPQAHAADEEANMLAIPRKQRAMVRKGIKNGLVSEHRHHVDRFFALYADNVHRHGTPACPSAGFRR
jgi:hypothetical protein